MADHETIEPNGKNGFDGPGHTKKRNRQFSAAAKRPSLNPKRRKTTIIGTSERAKNKAGKAGKGNARGVNAIAKAARIMTKTRDLAFILSKKQLYWFLYLSFDNFHGSTALAFQPIDFSSAREERELSDQKTCLGIK
jgi:hypothetical protein